MAMSRWERKAALRYGRAKEIAEKLGLSESLVSQVLHGTKRHRDIEVAIARAIGRAVDDVFPPKDEAFAATNGATV